MESKLYIVINGIPLTEFGDKKEILVVKEFKIL